MSKKIDDAIAEQMESAPVPFFAHLLTNQESPSVQGGAPTDWCWDNPCPTKKYPSDGDEPTLPTWDR